MTMVEMLEQSLQFYRQFLEDRRPGHESWSEQERKDNFGVFLAGITAYVGIKGTSEDRKELMAALEYTRRTMC